MARLKDLLVDPELSNDGVEFRYDHGVVWKVARWGNPRFRQELQKRLMRLPAWQRRKFEESGDDDMASDKIVRAVFGQTCLVGWSGLEDVAFSPQKASELCLDDAFDPVYRELVSFSQTIENYRDAAVEEASGNLPSGSSGASSGANSSDNSAGSKKTGSK